MAKDSAHEFSDAEIRAFEREVAGVYGEASKTAYAILKRYLAQFEADDEKMRERLGAGKITKAQYRSWRSGKIAAGRRYRIVLKQCAEAMTHANVVAAAAIEGRLPEVYAENYNYGTWQVESAVGVDTAYALQDASTVQRLLTDHDSYLPKPSVNVAKDVAWNRRLIANQITQGVLLGESIPKIAKRIQDVAGSNRAAAVRLARTSTTAAENAGRVDSYKRAKGLGIKVQQEWMATLDLRTRSSHRQLDGEKVEVGEKFSNGCRYPGDPEAPYAETCNCRCTLIACCDGLDVLDGERFSRLPEGMTYEEWKAGKPAVNGAKPADRTISEFMEMPGTARKLDAAGVSPTEARKRLTEQLKEYGIPSGSFRKMSAGDQQKVLDAALARIRRIAGKPDMSASVYSCLNGDQRDAVKGILKRSDKAARSVYLKHERDFVLLNGGWDKTAHYNPTDGGVRLNLERVFSKDGLRPQGTTWFHEFGHMVDGLNSNISETYKGGVFAKTIKKEANAYIDARNKEMREGFKRAKAAKDLGWLEANGYISKWKVDYLRKHPDNVAEAISSLKHTKADAYRSVESEIWEMSDADKADLSDLFGGATLNKCSDGWEHSKSYWRPKGATEDYQLARLAHEGFAEFFSASTANPESLAVLRKYLPESSKIFEEMLEELI